MTSSVTVSLFALACIATHFVFRALGFSKTASLIPLLLALLLGGIPAVWTLALHLFRREFSADVLAGVSILSSVILGEYLAGATIVLMFSGGAALESYALRRASAVLEALARRAPSIAHRAMPEGLIDVPLGEIAIGDTLVILPHELAPVDAVVTGGHGSMDESYLTGEPFEIVKAPGSAVLSGAVNGPHALTVRAEKLPIDSRYARIVAVMRDAEQNRPAIRRLADRLGAWYTPVGLIVAGLAWIASGDPHRFLAVVVIATPCPLLLAIPVAVLGAISASARAGIVIRNPGALEQMDHCRTMIFDKTGTVTSGKPVLSEILCAPDVSRDEVLGLAASLETYSRHPLAGAVLRAAREAGIRLRDVERVSEQPGQGLQGELDGTLVEITGRKTALARGGEIPAAFSFTGLGLECVILVNHRFAALLRFRDEARPESRRFIHHLKPRHRIRKSVLLSGDRESEVRFLSEQIGVTDIYWGKSPEEKVEIVKQESKADPVMYVGDGINDAAAMMTATVGVAVGTSSDILTEAADAVIMEPSLARLDELMHIGHRMRVVALQSAIGGMALSGIGMMIAAAGYLPPVSGAVAQEVIDLCAVLNALRVSITFRELRDFEREPGLPGESSLQPEQISHEPVRQ